MESENDDSIFRLLLPSFDQLISSEPTKAEICGIIRFLRNLKALVRQTNCVCLISVEERILDRFLVNNLHFLADQVWQITSFKDHLEMQIGDYDGTLKLLK